MWNRDKRIIMVVDAAPPLYGGAGQQAVLLADELEQALEVPIEVWSRRRQRGLESRYGRVRMVGPFVSVDSLSHLCFSIAVFFRLLFTRVAAVHVHGAFYYGFAAIAAGRIRRVPSLLKMTLLGVDDPEAVSRLTLARLPVGRLVVRQFLWANRVIALNAETAEAARTFDRDVNATIIPNGVLPPPDIRDRRDDLDPMVIFTGVLSKRKGVNTLVSAWTAFLKHHPRAMLTLAGPAGDAVDEITDLEELGVATVGLLSRQDLSAALKNANLFVLPSLAEGLPNSAIEAMSYGLPMVLSDIPVNRSTASDAAIYFRAGDAEALTDALVAAWSSRNQLGTKSLHRSEGFQMSHVAAKYVSIYDSLLVKQSHLEESRA